MQGETKGRGWWSKAKPYAFTGFAIVGVHIVFGCVFFCVAIYQDFSDSYSMNPGIALVTYPIVFLVGLGCASEMFGAVGLFPALFACLVCLVSRYAGPLLGIRWWLLSLLVCCGLLCIPCEALPWGMGLSDDPGDDSGFLYEGYPRILLAFFFLLLWTVLLLSDKSRGSEAGESPGP